jgi:hypothetical protein
MMILPALTSIIPNLWREKVKEINSLGLSEVAVFPTCLNYEERQELFGLLEKTCLKKIPFMHLREEDMLEAELDYLVDRWGLEKCNVHPRDVILKETYLPKYRGIVYVENSAEFLDEKYLRGFAGLCVDFSHLENDRRLFHQNYEQILSLAMKYPVGCGHASAIYEKQVHNRLDGSPEKRERFDGHYAESEKCFDYLKSYPKEFLPPILAIEVENSLAEQLKFKKYIREMLNT